MIAEVHEQDHDDDDNPENPEIDLDNYHPDDSYPCRTQILRRHLRNTLTGFHQTPHLIL